LPGNSNHLGTGRVAALRSRHGSWFCLDANSDCVRVRVLRPSTTVVSSDSSNNKIVELVRERFLEQHFFDWNLEVQLVTSNVLIEHIAVPLVWLVDPLAVMSKNLNVVLKDVLVIVDWV